MRDQSLFERLEQATNPPQPLRPFSTSLLVSSVLDNVRRIFNARQGSCETRSDYGVPDLNDIVTIYPTSCAAVERAIRQQLELFEPRLHSVDVHFSQNPDDPLSLGFYVDAVLIGENNERLRVDVKFESNPDDPLAVGISLDGNVVGKNR